MESINSGYLRKKERVMAGYMFLKDLKLAEKLSPVFTEILKERIMQNEKWGEQNHSLLNQFITSDICKSKANFFKKINKRKKYFRSWFTIFAEEFYEAFAEIEPENQREEMIQVAALAVTIIEYIDRQIEKNEETL
jgi:NTP pyrophosphatase (non-canonical NTP hydrolase)